MKNNQIYRDGRVINSEIKLQFVDRLRLICGMKIFIQTEVASQWRMGTTEAKNTFMIQKLFPRTFIKVPRILARFQKKQS